MPGEDARWRHSVKGDMYKTWADCEGEVNTERCLGIKPKYKVGMSDLWPLNLLTSWFFSCCNIFQIIYERRLAAFRCRFFFFFLISSLLPVNQTRFVFSWPPPFRSANLNVPRPKPCRQESSLSQQNNGNLFFFFFYNVALKEREIRVGTDFCIKWLWEREHTTSSAVLESHVKSSPLRGWKTSELTATQGNTLLFQPESLLPCCSATSRAPPPSARLNC